MFLKLLTKPGQQWVKVSPIYRRVTSSYIPLPSLHVLGYYIVDIVFSQKNVKWLLILNM